MLPLRYDYLLKNTNYLFVFAASLLRYVYQQLNWSLFLREGARLQSRALVVNDYGLVVHQGIGVFVQELTS